MKHIKVKNYHEEYKDYKTEKQWAKIGFKIKDNATGVELWQNQFCNSTFIYYSENEVVKMSDSEFELYKKERNKENYERYKIRKKEKEEEEKREAYLRAYNTLLTSWQWLYHCHREILENAEPILNDCNDFYYYRKTETKEISEERFEELKLMYVEKYGGWKKIDLENTRYNGKKWY